MHVRYSLLGLVLLVACSACSKPEVYLCSADNGQISEQAKPCPPSAARPDLAGASDSRPAANAGAHLLTRLPLTTLKLPDNQTVTWLNWAYTDDNDAMYLRALAQQTGYFISGRFASGQALLQAVDLNSGKTLWRYPATETFVDVALGADRLYSLTTGHRLLRAHDPATGRVLAERNLPTPLGELMPVGGVLALVDQHNQLVGLDPHTLAERWRITPPAFDLYTVQVFGDLILLVDNDYQVHAYDGATGQPRWARRMGDSGYLQTGTAVFYMDRLQTKVHTLDADTGEVVATFSFDSEDHLSLDAFGQTLYKYLASSNKVRAFDPSSGKALWTMTLPNDYDFLDLRLMVRDATLLLFDKDHTRLLIADNRTGELLDKVHLPIMTFTADGKEPKPVLAHNSRVMLFE